MAEKKIQELTYAEATQELEAIVCQLEAGNLELEDSLAYYKRGNELVKELSARLQAAKDSVEELASAADTKTNIEEEEIS